MEQKSEIHMFWPQTCTKWSPCWNFDIHVHQLAKNLTRKGNQKVKSNYSTRHSTLFLTPTTWEIAYDLSSRISLLVELPVCYWFPVKTRKESWENLSASERLVFQRWLLFPATLRKRSFRSEPSSSPDLTFGRRKKIYSNLKVDGRVPYILVYTDPY